jgi:hypothetical protein
LPHRARELASLRLLPKLDRVAIRTSELRYLTPPRPGSLGGQARPLGSDVAQNPENCAAEIPQRLANPRGCRAHFCRPDMAHRDGTVAFRSLSYLFEMSQILPNHAKSDYRRLFRGRTATAGTAPPDAEIRPSAMTRPAAASIAVVTRRFRSSTVRLEGSAVVADATTSAQALKNRKLAPCPVPV